MSTLGLQYFEKAKITLYQTISNRIPITIFFILYFFKLPSKSIISLLFGELSNIDYFFTFFSIDSQPCGQNVVFCGQSIYLWVPLTLYLVTSYIFCRVLKTGKEKGPERVQVCPLSYPRKKLTDLHDLQKWARAEVGGTSSSHSPFDAATGL